jgi:ABC-type bacteriocin/lantibiotic exporter with double-glycine peptidase domain
VYLNFLKRLGDASPLIAPVVLVLIMTLMCLTLEKEIPNRNLFIALYLLYQLCAPINELRVFIQIVYHLFPANQRLKEYLLNEQIDHKSNQSGENSIERGSIQIEGGYFSSDYQIPMPTLLDVNLDVLPGSLVTIVGENPLECTNLLHALAGELKRLDGQVEVNGSLGYVPANAWLLNASIAENIQFVADKLDQQLYEQLIEKCELTDVLKLEANNQTRKCNLVSFY